MSLLLVENKIQAGMLVLSSVFQCKSNNCNKSFPVEATSGSHLCHLVQSLQMKVDWPTPQQEHSFHSPWRSCTRLCISWRCCMFSVCCSWGDKGIRWALVNSHTCGSWCLFKPKCSLIRSRTQKHEGQSSRHKAGQIPSLQRSTNKQAVFHCWEPEWAIGQGLSRVVLTSGVEGWSVYAELLRCCKMDAGGCLLDEASCLCVRKCVGYQDAVGAAARHSSPSWCAGHLLGQSPFRSSPSLTAFTFGNPLGWFVNGWFLQ